MNESTELKSSTKNFNLSSESPNVSNVSSSSISNNNGDNATVFFSELIDVASSSIEKIDNDVRLMSEETFRQIAEVFKNVRSAKFINATRF